MITDQRQIFNWLKANFSGFDSYLVMRESSETNWKTLKSRNFTYFVMRVRDDYIADRKEYLIELKSKITKINEEIDQMRHSATQSLLSRDDVIVVSSVSCIYGIGEIEEYKNIE